MACAGTLNQSKPLTRTLLFHNIGFSHAKSREKQMFSRCELFLAVLLCKIDWINVCRICQFYEQFAVFCLLSMCKPSICVRFDSLA